MGNFCGKKGGKNFNMMFFPGLEALGSNTFKFKFLSQNAAEGSIDNISLKGVYGKLKGNNYEKANYYVKVSNLKFGLQFVEPINKGK